MPVIRKIVWLILIFYFSGCTNSLENNDSNNPIIENIYFNYDGNESRVYISCDLFNSPNNIDDYSIVFELHQSSETLLQNSLVRQFEVSNGSIISYWGSFDLEVESNKLYFLKVYFLDESGITISSSRSSSKLLGNSAPEIISVNVPLSFSLDPTDWQNLIIKLFYCDTDGWDDLIQAEYYVKRNWSCLDGSSPVIDSDYNQFSSSQLFQMAINSSNINSSDCTYELNAILQMRPLDGSALIENGEEIIPESQYGCGMVGETLFKFIIRDSKGQSSTIDNIKMVITE
ncbi:MAG: hypothetical protein CBD58_03990 [bacterium TMED198]|nr:MAG: hypothetical protein CBD58_03990 [bacterium TMED198]